MREDLRSGGRAYGGTLGYPQEQLLQEVAYLAYYFHWPHSQIMDMNHLERLVWVDQVARINKRLNESVDSEN
jgi:hypothetical protein